jgi:hypothetical protein
MPKATNHFCARRAVVCPNDGAVDHLQGIGIAAPIGLPLVCRVEEVQ